MSTGAQYTAITSKRIMGTQDFGARFLDYLSGRTVEDFERVYANGGVYDTNLGIAADGADQIQITGTSQATDGDGNLFDITNLSEKDGIQFENANGITYYVGMKHAVYPVDVAVNPRTGLPDYTHYEDYIGNSADPNSVVDNGSNLTFVVDSITESGHSYAGRRVMVYMKTPAEGGVSAAIAIETATVVWSGTQNQITTSGLLGQVSPSVDSADYTVLLLGPIVSTLDISSTDGICFLGTVIGVGLGSPPTVFDTSGQNLIEVSMSDFGDFTRVESSNGRIKIDVKALSSEVGIDQIRVTKLGTGVVFSVDEDGNVTIEGDLNVIGTTTQEDVVQVNSSETITDNLTAGDDQFADSHLIKGTWRHTNNAEGANYFYINGSTGRVGIGGVDDGTHALAITGDLAVNGDSDLTNLNVSGSVQTNLIPSAATTHNLGSATYDWNALYVNSVFTNNLANIGGGGSIDLDADLIPTGSDDTYDLGSVSAMMSSVYTHDLVLDSVPGRGVGSDIAPQADNTYDIGTATRRWGTLYAVNVNFSGDFLPQVDNTQDIGSATYRWAEGHFYDVIVYNSLSVASSSIFTATSNNNAITATGSGTGAGVYATGGATNGNGVTGIGTSNGEGVHGESANGYGVRGISTNSTGVYGSTTDGYGVFGFSSTSYGVYAQSASSYGLYATSSSSYAIVAAGDTSSPVKAALRLLPQNAAPTSPFAGDIYYNSSTNHFYGYTGSSWVQLDN